MSGLFYGIIYNLIDPGVVKAKNEEMHKHLQFMEEQLRDKYFAGQWEKQVITKPEKFKI